jgi:hypothetical protein
MAEVNNDRSLAEELLQGLVDDSVSEKLGTIAQRIHSHVKETTQGDTPETRQYEFRVLSNACGAFLAKAKERLDKSS